MQKRRIERREFVALQAVYDVARGRAGVERLELFGDLIRAFRRLIDLCRQLAESPEVEASLRAQLWNTVSALDRGIVFESALI